MEFKNRKRNRKKGFDYTSEQIYFVTICTHEKFHYFGQIENKCMNLNDFGQIAESQIFWLEEHYAYVNIHNAVVMPNHVHILIEIDSHTNPKEIKVKSISELIGAYKTTVSKMIHLFGNFAFKWQRSFHDHIVRDANGYENIYNYISENPAKWEQDIHNNEFTVGTSRDLS
jgi:putative transposase